MRSSLLSCALPVILACAPSTYATLVYSHLGSTYNQSFDDLGSSGIDIQWTNDVTIDGWYLFRRNSSTFENPPVAVSVYDTTDGTSNNGKFYSFGIAGNGERALGAVGNSNFDGQPGLAPGFGDVAGWIALGVLNTSGVVLDQFTVSFDGEQWFDPGDGPGDNPQTMVFQYGFGDSFDAVTNWITPGGNFDWSAPVDGDSTLIGIGNSIGQVSHRGGTRSNLNWEDGKTLWLRWLERNDIAADAGMAIDSFSFSAAAVPEPTAASLGIAVCGLILLTVISRQFAWKSFKFWQERLSRHLCAGG